MPLFLVTSMHAHLTFSLNHLFYINKGVCSYDQSLMIFPAALVLGACNPFGSRFLQMIKSSSFRKGWKPDKNVVKIGGMGQIQVSFQYVFQGG